MTRSDARKGIEAEGASAAVTPALPVAPSLALGLLCMAFFVDVLGSTSVFTASPQIEGALGLSQAGLQWSFTAATLPGAALLLVGGRLADLYGRRRMFTVGLALFTLASLACGVAPNAAAFIAARAAQGAAGALLMPAALSLLMGLFPDGPERNRALAAWSAIGGIGATLGLLLGGLVTAGASWQWVFFINVPTGLAMLALTPLLLREPSTAETTPKIDVPGTITITAGLALLIYAVSRTPAVGWVDLPNLGIASAAVVLLAAFVHIERRSDNPMVPPRLFHARMVTMGNVVLLVAGMCVDGLLFVLTLYTQRVLGYNALQFGAVAAIMTVSSVGAAWLAQRVLSRLGAPRVSSTGLVLLVLTCLVFALASSHGGGLAALSVGMVVFGLGMGSAFVAGSVASLHEVEEQDSGIAAGVQNISFTVGTTVGVGVLSAVSALGSAFGPAFVGGAVIAALGLGASALARGRPAVDSAPL